MTVVVEDERRGVIWKAIIVISVVIEIIDAAVMAVEVKAWC